MILLILFIVLVCLSVLVLKLAIDSVKRKSEVWGFNLRPVNCPNCNQPVPRMRAPNSTRQALFGGWTCSGCGIEMDKWGTDISSVEEFERSRLAGAKRPDSIEPFDTDGKTPIERVFHDDD